MNKTIVLSITTTLLLTSVVMADSTVKASNDLAQSINLGFSNTTGNTETMNLNAKYEASFTTTGYQEQALKVAFDTSAYLTENNDVKSNEEFLANLSLEQMVSDSWLGYASVNWLKNEFLNYDNKFSIGVGVGKEIFNDGQHSLKVKLGAAYNIEKYTSNVLIDGVSQNDNSFASLNEYLEYNNKLNAVSSLYLKVGAMQNMDDTKDYEVMGVLGVKFIVAENINVSIEEEVRYDAKPASAEKTDTKTIIRVGYNF